MRPEGNTLKRASQFKVGQPRSTEQLSRAMCSLLLLLLLLMIEGPTLLVRRGTGEGNRRMSGRALVAMMQAAQSGTRNHVSRSFGPNSAVRSLLGQAQVGSVFMVIAGILGKKSFQVALVYCEDVVQQLRPATAHPALCNPVLPRTVEGSLDRCHVHGLN
jgi:hypothetical protein